MSVGKCLSRLLLCVTFACIILTPAGARVWKATPDAIARDYAMIQDVRGKGDLVILIWFVPALVPPSTNGAAAAAAALDKYVVIAVVHAHQDQVIGMMSFEEINTLEARDRNGNPLTLVPKESLPPILVGMMAAMEMSFRQSLGAMGKGMKLFLFDAGAVHSCTKGGLTVPFASETYTWDTPIPGCPHA